ncbi:MAG: hypothetical protein ACREHG_04980 [Candidatus Saccharimonadales bacterium]
MTSQIRGFELTIPAGTAKASPLTLDMSFPPMTVQDITVTVPPGPNGNLGIQIAAAEMQVIPWNQGEWLVPNDVVMSWEPQDYADAGSWQLIGYNTGTYDHTVWVRFSVLPVGTSSGAATSTPIDNSTLSNAGSVG